MIWKRVLRLEYANRPYLCVYMLWLAILGLSPVQAVHIQTIPRIIHHSWKTSNVPEMFKSSRKSWLDHHPGWHERLWTDEQNRDLVKKHFPWIQKVYDDLPAEIMRADTARVLYMYQYGGIYADLDVIAMKPFEKLLRDHSVLVAMMSNDTEFEHNIPNAWMASVPGHPFWLYCLATIIENAKICQLQSDKCGAEEIAGPIMLKDSLAVYERIGLDHDVTVLAPGIIYPVDWHRANPSECNPRLTEFNLTQCVGLFPKSYAVTFWAHSWGRRRLIELREGDL